MEIYQLKVFLEVAQHLSFTAAADSLNLTQPAVSAKIKSLEANLGTALFHRLGRKIELTVVGDYLLEAGPSLLALEARLTQEIEQVKQGESNQLNIGCTTTIASGWLPKILFAYRQKYPEIALQCTPFEVLKDLHQAMTSRAVDVGFSETDLSGFEADSSDKIASVPVDSFQYCLVVAADHRLAQAKWLSLRGLTSEIWAFPETTTPEGLALTSRLSELGMEMTDFPHREIVRSPSLMSAFLSQGHYLGFASSLQFQTERQAKLLTAIPLQEFSLDIKLFMLKHSKKNSATQKLLSTKPLQQLIQLISERARHERSGHEQMGLDPKAQQRKRSQQAGSKRTRPVYFKSSSLSLHRSNTPEPLTISIGTQNKTIQTVTAGIIIQQLGLLEHFLPQGGKYNNTEYQIQWQDFTSGAPIVAGLQADRLDIGILGDYPLLLSGVAPTDAKTEATNPIAKTRLVSFVASNPDGAGNTVIVPNQSPLTSLDDLRRRVIAVPFASAAHGMMMRSLARADLLPEVTLTSIDNLSIHRLTPRDNQADGYAYFAPLHDIASHKGKFRRLLEDDAQKLPTFHGIVVREAFAEAHPDIVIAYLKALIAAQYWYETTPSALSLVSNWVRLDPEIVAKTLDYQRSGAVGLFFPETQIRTDWVADHIEQLSTISGNEALGKLNLEDWIQPELLEMALATL
ncbi:MAG: LysR substrate-binding domain-containing protein [Cyanobacteria bacterium J06597_16]